MNIARLAIEKKTISFVMTVLICMGGVFSYQKMGRLEDPAFTIKSAKVNTFYPGATALEVSEEVTDEIETAIQKLGTVDYVKSLSMPGVSSIHVELKPETPKEAIPQVWDELRRKVGDVQDQLPGGTSTSVVNDDFGDVYGIFYALHGDGYSYAELKEHADTLRRELLLVQDVADVTLFGTQQEAVYVEISRARMGQLGIAPDVVMSSLAGQNMVAPAGSIEVGNQYIRIHPTGELKSIQEIGDILILQPDGGSRLYLKDIATIRRGYKQPATSLVYFNGLPAIGIGISTIDGGNVITMGKGVDRRLAELLEQTPVGMELGIISHQAASVVTSINGFFVSLLEAIAIVVGVLIFAMGLRSGLLIGWVLLLTILATFIVMKVNGVVLERISLGALIIALGMLVDNAIVVVEGIIVNSQKGMKKVEAAAAIVQQTIWPLFGATIVAVLAFAAIGTSTHSSGEYCRSLYQVMLYSLMLSWVTAITLTPLFGVLFLKVKPQAKGQAEDPYKGALFQGYRKLLTFCMRNRIATVALLLVMLLLAGFGFGHVNKSFFPDSTRPQFMVHYWMPQGTQIGVTEAAAKEISDKLRTKYDGITDVAATVGRGALRFLLTYTPEEPNSAYALLMVSVDDYKAIPALMGEIENFIKTEYPDAQAYCRRFVLGPGDPFKIQARLRGPDPDVLRQLAVLVEQVLRVNPNVKDISTDWRQRVPLIRSVVAENQARNAGLTRSDIAQGILYATEGKTVGYYREKDDLLPIIARSPNSERTDVADLNNVQLYSPAGRAFIPLTQVLVGFETSSENQIIRRRNRQPTLTIRCDAKGATTSAVFEQLRPVVEAIPLPAGYGLEWGGEYEDSGKAQTALMSKMPVIGMMMLLIIIILFNSIKKPAIIFLTAPLALIGVTVGLLVFDQPFGFMALLGFLSLSGMLIKNSVVLIDEINCQLATGKDPYLAVVDSGVSRVRPVSMAAATTVLGMVPLLADAFFVAMAVTIMVGLTFATVLTLIVVPLLYVMFFKIKEPASTH